MTEVIFLGMKLLISLASLLIAGVAVRAYGRYGNRPLLFVAIDFFLIALGDGLEGLLTEFTDMDLYQASLIHAALTLTGLMSVIYSLCDGNLKEFTP